MMNSLWIVVCTAISDVRMEDMFYEKLDKKKRDRENLHESLGNVMVDAGNEYGPGTSYGMCLKLLVFKSWKIHLV